MKHARSDYNRIQDPAKLIPEDEPVFLLRGQDKFAPQMLDHYLELMFGVVKDQKMFDLVSQLQDDMMDWQVEHRVKIPDLPIIGTTVRRDGALISIDNGRIITSFNMNDVYRISQDSRGGCSVFWKSDKTSNHFDCDYDELRKLVFDEETSVPPANKSKPTGTDPPPPPPTQDQQTTVDEFFSRSHHVTLKGDFLLFMLGNDHCHRFNKKDITKVSYGKDGPDSTVVELDNGAVTYQIAMPFRKFLEVAGFTVWANPELKQGVLTQIREGISALTAALNVLAPSSS